VNIGVSIGLPQRARPTASDNQTGRGIVLH
jgi:hypothetical protein